MRIMMPSAVPYNPKPVLFSGKRPGRKTRMITEEEYIKQLKAGCPHCKTAIAPVLKGKGENFGGVFAACKNDKCGFATESRYYYISPTCERVNEFT
jgi:hypothetical protein